MNLFKVTTPKLSMNHNVIISLIILAGITSSGLAYAVTNGSITTGNLTVTGTCSGCGGSGSFTTYSTSLNSTIAGTSAGTNIGLFVGIDGSIIQIDTSGHSAIVKLDGTVITVKPVAVNFDSLQTHIAQSVDGKYKAILSTTSSSIYLYNNNVLLQTIGVDPTQFSVGDYSKVSIAISSDGKYIAVSGGDTGGALQRIVIFGGT